MSHKDKQRNLDKCVSESDYERFVKMFNECEHCCYLCGERFTTENKPTLDRINNDIGHEITNCKLACVECNKLRSREDADITRLRIQLKQYCKLHNLPTLINDDDEYRTLRDGIVGGLSNVGHRVNIKGETKINKLHYDEENNTVVSRDTNNIQTGIIGLDFNSLYPSCFSSTTHEFIRYHGHKMYMPGSFIRRITDKQQCINIIKSNSRFSENPNYVFIADVKLRCPREKINNFINFPPVFRHIKITNNEETLGKYMHAYMKRNKFIGIDKETDILTQLIDTHNEYMTFNNYYLWFLLDHGIELEDVKSVSLYSAHTGFNKFVNEFMNKRLTSNNQLFYKLILNGSFGYDGINTEHYMSLKLCDENKAYSYILSQAYINGSELENNTYIIQQQPRYYRCRTPLQEAYWTLDNAKYWYLTFVYDFINKCYDSNKFHFINLDTDSLYIAVSGNPIANQSFYDNHYFKFLPNDEINDVHDRKKLLGCCIERQADNMIALAPKCYSVFNSNGKEVNKLKGIDLSDNNIHHDDYE